MPTKIIIVVMIKDKESENYRGKLVNSGKVCLKLLIKFTVIGVVMYAFRGKLLATASGP